MTIARRNIVVAELTNAATLSALETVLATAVSGLTSGFLPEDFEGIRIDETDGDLRDGIIMQVDKAPYQSFLSTTAAVFKLIDTAAYADIASLNTAIQAIIQTQETASKTLRVSRMIECRIAGVPSKLLFMLFTDGTAPVS